MTTRNLRLLLIEDSEDDALLAVEEVCKGGYAPDCTRVDTPQAVEAALESDHWDVAIVDYNLPSFTGMDALRIIQEKGLDIPLFLVSGAIGEEQVVEAMKAGFHDVIVKGHYTRLAQALGRELREAGIRRERREALEELRRAHAELEQRVAERTAELVLAHQESEQTNRRLRLEIEARKKAEAALLESEKQLQAINYDLERRVERRTRELQETQRQYLHAEKLAAIGRLSASIAHEFNNPLQGIMSILNGLKKRAILEEEDRELLNAAIDESKRIKDLISSLREFNRPSSGRKVVMDVQKSIDSLLLLQESDFRSKRIAVVLNYAERLPQIMAVQDQIEQVFLNLLANAADACPPSGGVITISTRREDQRVAVAISDTGIGIRPEQMDLLFQPFYTTKPEVKGTGLGLSICYGIVQHHQGEIRV
ncbi:MAG: ATP-binding protein, partial [Desulfoprunum sp.]|uniref:sensor histidine kinase n=1 Tax=Desulfoprunum sp. TaxID=2020866 RepID=UPI003C7963C1